MSWFGRLDVQCKYADLLDMDVDGIICNTNIMLNLNYSIGRQLSKRCGPELERKLDDILMALPNHELPLGQSVCVRAFNMERIRSIIFTAWWSAENDFRAELIYQCHASALRSALNENMKSLAFPLFGTGSQTMRLPTLAAGIACVLNDFDALKGAESFSLEELYFVSNNEGDCFPRQLP